MNLIRTENIKKIKIQTARLFVIFLLVFAGLSVHAQIDVAGEIDFSNKTFTNDKSPGSADLFTDADFKLYPNPARDVIKIQSKVKLKKGVVITLSDMRGNLIEKRVIGTQLSQNDYSIDLSRYSGGQYVIGILSIDGSYVTKKLIKR